MEGVGRNQDLRPHVLDAGDRADHYPGQQPTKSSSTSFDQKVGYEIIKGAVKRLLVKLFAAVERIGCFLLGKMGSVCVVYCEEPREGLRILSRETMRVNCFV